MQRVIAHLVGGVGNQLFIYAAGWALAQRTGAELILDVSAFPRDAFYRRTYALAQFNLGEVAVRHGASPVEQFIHRQYRRLRVMFPSMPHRLGPILGERDHLHFDPSMTDGSLRIFPTVYLFGYRQNERYFADQAAGLRQKLTFMFEPSVEARAQADEILGCNAVCVHFPQLHQVRAGATHPHM